MKTKFLTCLCSFALALSVFGQTPPPVVSPAAPAAPSPGVATASVGASVSPAATVSVTPYDDDDDSIEAEVARKLKRRFGISVSPSGVTVSSPHGTTVTSRHHDNDDFADGALMAIPIIGIVFVTLFGAPVLIVAAIMFFSYLKSRSLHRTVRSMVERGQEVPAALFAPPPVVRARSDMRKGIVLVMVGIGMMIFFAAVNDWEGGAWALGIIPFLIGAGYLAVWKLEGAKSEAAKDKVPPLP